MEPKIDAQLLEITSKVKRLKDRMVRLEEENEHLKKSVFSYLQQLENQKKMNSQLATEMTNFKLAKSLKSPSKELNKEIDKYLLLLEKCIAAVNSKM